MLVKKSFYFREFDTINEIRTKVDFMAVDPYKEEGNVIIFSSVDAPAKLDKLRADYNKGILKRGYIFNETDYNLYRSILRENNYDTYSTWINFRGVDFNILKTKVGKLSHLLITQKNNSEYIYKFNNEDSIVDLIMNKLINVYFIPCKSDNVQEVLLTKPEVIKEMIMITDNDDLEHIKVYSFDKDLFIETLNKLSKDKGEIPDPIFEKFVGDFTGYINYFKPDILDNLYSKIDEFYDKDNVPPYVTEYPYPLPNQDMRNVLNKISNKYYNKDIFSLGFDEQVKVYETYKRLDAQGKIIRSKTFNPQWSKQYVCWSAAMRILEEEKFCYMSLVMGSGKTKSSLKANRYTCTTTLKRNNFLTFILCPQSTLSQWQEEIFDIERGVGNTKEDYDVVIVHNTKVLMDFFKKHSRRYKNSIRFDKTKIKKPTYLLCGKEAFKLSQTERPAFNLDLDRAKNPILLCPNCGKPLTNTKKVKGKETKLFLQLDDFFNGTSKSKRASNLYCEECEKELKKYREFIEEEENLKDSIDGYKPKNYECNFIPKDNSKLWVYDNNSTDIVRNKIFSKLEPSKQLTNEYTKFTEVSKLKEELKARKERKESLLEGLDVRRTVAKESTKKISAVEFIKKRKIEFDSVIIDEAHEGNNAESLIGTAQRLLFKYSKKVILLSGTANNGYASSLHNLLMAAMPHKLKEDGTFEKKEFVKKYGILQGVIKVDENCKISGKADISGSKFKEVEGINPVVFTKFLSKNFIMVNTLQELDLPMPNLIEKYVPIETEESQLQVYNELYTDISSVNPYIAKMYKASIFKNFINNPYSWGEIEVNDMTGGQPVTIKPKNLNRNTTPYLEKDYELLEIIKKEKEEGRKCFLFTDFGDGGKYIQPETITLQQGDKIVDKELKLTINDRLCKLLEDNGIRYMVLKSNTTSVSNRKNYIEERKEDYDVFICQPQLVNVGLNLVFCPTYIVYTPYYRYDIISQATRRGYRANSVVENRIYHLYYKDTCEEDIINRYQRKLAEAKAIEGDFFVNIEKGKDLRTLSKVSDTIVKN